jgi:hypothetical protein
LIAISQPEAALQEKNRPAADFSEKRKAGDID